MHLGLAACAYIHLLLIDLVEIFIHTIILYSHAESSQSSDISVSLWTPSIICELSLMKVSEFKVTPKRLNFVNFLVMVCTNINHVGPT